MDCIVGKDDHKEDPKRLYESCYCYENAFGNGVTSSSTTKDFSQEYKDKHKLLIASRDFMRSGCLAEILSDYHINNYNKLKQIIMQQNSLSAEEYHKKMEENGILQSAYSSESAYNNAMHKLLKERINSIAPDIEEYERKLLIRKNYYDFQMILPTYMH